MCQSSDYNVNAVIVLCCLEKAYKGLTAAKALFCVFLAFMARVWCVVFTGVFTVRVKIISVN